MWKLKLTVLSLLLLSEFIPEASIKASASLILSSISLYFPLVFSFIKHNYINAPVLNQQIHRKALSKFKVEADCE